MIDKEIIMLVGASASGKSYYANKKEKQGYVVICRDDLRRLYLESFTDNTYNPNISLWEQWQFNHKAEQWVSELQTTLISNAMIEGKSIVLADTNISPKTRNSLFRLIKKVNRELGEEYDLHVKRFDVPLLTLLERDNNRLDKVGVDVIMKQYSNLQQKHNSVDSIYKQFDLIKI